MLTAAKTIEHYAALGAQKAAKSAGRLFILGILAGVFIAAGGAAAAVAAVAAPNAAAARMAAGLVFPAGLAMVMLAGAELFTGNCLIGISVLHRVSKIGPMARNLALVYLGNFVGAALFALLSGAAGLPAVADGALALYFIKTAVAKSTISFGGAVASGILCNVLVCTGVLCSLAGQSVPGRVLGAWPPVALFVICGFEHCVANMYYVPAGLYALAQPAYAEAATAAGVDLTNLTIPAFLLNNLAPVTLGNVAGGLLLAAGAWACWLRPAPPKTIA